MGEDEDDDEHEHDSGRKGEGWEFRWDHWEMGEDEDDDEHEHDSGRKEARGGKQRQDWAKNH